MDKFTKLNLNGVDKFVSAIYDGSGNEIVSTYETKTDSTSKLETINQSINTTNTNLSALEARVVETEKYKTAIDSNTSNIEKNATDITTLQGVDTKFREDLDALDLQVNEDEKLITTNKTNIGALQTLSIALRTDVDLLKASVNDEAMGLVALNKLADENTGAIGVINQALAQVQQQAAANQKSIEAIRGDIVTHIGELGKLKEVTDPLPAKVQSLGEYCDKINGDVQGMKSSLDNKISKETYEALLARVVVLEQAMAKYHPEEQPAE